jgi:hypothetical protein
LLGVEGIGGIGHFGVAGREVEVAIEVEGDDGATVPAPEPGEEDFLAGGIDEQRGLLDDAETGEP